MHIFYAAASSYYQSGILLLHSSYEDFDIYNLPVNESYRREMGQLETKISRNYNINTDRIVK